MFVSPLTIDSSINLRQSCEKLPKNQTSGCVEKNSLIFPSSVNVLAKYGQNISFASSGSFGSQESYLDYLNNTSDSPNVIASKLTSALNHPKTRNAFISELIAEPSKSNKIVSLLVHKLGGKKNFLAWYLADDGYLNNYDKYLNDRYQKAKSLSELLTIQPNWGYWALERKQCALLGYNSKKTQDDAMLSQNVNFWLGKLPEEIKSHYAFEKIVDEMKRVPWLSKGKFYFAGDSGVYQHLPGGDLSSKNIYKLTLGGKNYILKMNRFHPEKDYSGYKNKYFTRSIGEARLLRGDSVYLNACMDYYLQQNGCNSNAKLVYYDFNTNAALYEYVDADEVTVQTPKSLAEQIEANKIFSSINKLGVFLNDIGTSFNCYKDRNGKMKVLDMGHAEFIDLLRPGAKLLTIETPNVCGFSIKNVLAALNLDVLNNIESSKTDLREADFVGVSNRYSNDSNSSGLEKYNAVDVSNIDKNKYLQKLMSIPDYDLSYFVCNKDEIKSVLKRKLAEALDIDPIYHSRAFWEINARFELLEFYKKSLLARHAELLDNSSEVRYGILKAMQKEITLINKAFDFPCVQNMNLDDEKHKLDDYIFFYSVCAKGL